MGSAPSGALPVIKAKGEIHSTVPKDERQGEEWRLDKVWYVTHPNSQTGWLVQAERLDHHMLLLELQDALGSRSFIVAEKVGAPSQHAGLRILWYPSPRHLRSAQALSMPLTLCKQLHGCYPKALALRQVATILQDFDPAFDALSSNCQHYATEMWLRLLSQLGL